MASVVSSGGSSIERKVGVASGSSVVVLLPEVRVNSREIPVEMSCSPVSAINKSLILANWRSMSARQWIPLRLRVHEVNSTQKFILPSAEEQGSLQYFLRRMISASGNLRTRQPRRSNTTTTACVILSVTTVWRSMRLTGNSRFSRTRLSLRQYFTPW